MFPLAAFDQVDHEVADAALAEWAHFLGPCERPFGRHSFGLFVEQQLVAVAVSASTVSSTLGGYERKDVVECARLCTRPGWKPMTRVALRLWREIAPTLWGRDQWPVRAVVSYANKRAGHSGDVYRFDGWRKVHDVDGGTTGPNATWQPGKTYDAKSLWAYDLPEAA